jgi:syntaxin 16
MNELLKEVESKIKKYFNPKIENQIYDIIKVNMKKTLFTNLTNFSKKFKLNQKIYAEKYKEFIGEEDPTFNINTNEQNEQFLKTEESKKVLEKRDNELNLLLSNVNELTTIFKDIQTLVMEQGTILDRIDYNIDISEINIVKGKESIKKSFEYQSQNCFRNMILILLVVIFIESFLLILKFL